MRESTFEGVPLVVVKFLATLEWRFGLLSTAVV